MLGLFHTWQGTGILLFSNLRAFLFLQAACVGHAFSFFIYFLPWTGRKPCRVCGFFFFFLANCYWVEVQKNKYFCFMNLVRAQDANILFNQKGKITLYSRDCIQLLACFLWLTDNEHPCSVYYLLNLFWASEQKTTSMLLADDLLRHLYSYDKGIGISRSGVLLSSLKW